MLGTNVDSCLRNFSSFFQQNEGWEIGWWVKADHVSLIPKTPVVEGQNWPKYLDFCTSCGVHMPVDAHVHTQKAVFIHLKKRILYLIFNFEQHTE